MSFKIATVAGLLAACGLAALAFAPVRSELHWAWASTLDTPVSYVHFVTSWPESDHRPEAETRMEAQRRDPEPAERALAVGTRSALEGFLADFPGHLMEARVRERLQDIDGRDVADLLSRGLVEVRTIGSGIKYVEVELRRRTGYAVTAQLPVGTYFVAHNSGSQNMVSRSAKSVTLTDDDWHSVRIPAACANRARAIPGSSDRFTVSRSPQQRALQRLMPALGEAGVPYDVEQAAIWIVTDDADYGDLGVLVNGYGGGRVIDEAEAARAMRIVSDAGIDIRGRAIWRGRARIARSLPGGALREWLTK